VGGGWWVVVPIKSRHPSPPELAHDLHGRRDNLELGLKVLE
jgi:hypothetical protein